MILLTGRILRLWDNTARDLCGEVAYPKYYKQSVADIHRLAVRTEGVFINPALTEPFGLTLIELATHGLPMVATKNGGPAGIERTLKNEMLEDSHDDKAIAVALYTLMTDKNLWGQCRQNGLKNIDLYSWLQHYRIYLSRVFQCRMRHLQLQSENNPDDSEEMLQQKAAEALAKIISQCVRCKSGPNGNLIKNLCSLICAVSLDVVEARNSHGISFEKSPEPIYGTQFLPCKVNVPVIVPGDNSIDILTNDIGLVVISNKNGEPQGFGIHMEGSMGRTLRLLLLHNEIMEDEIAENKWGIEKIRRGSPDTPTEAALLEFGLLLDGVFCVEVRVEVEASKLSATESVATCQEGCAYYCKDVVGIRRK
eukprot:Gb_24777 [translate_table: standard]